MDPVTLWFILLSAIVSLYGFIYGYWSSKGIPSPSLWLIKRLFLPQHLHDQLLYQNYGDVVGFFEGMRPTLLISSPDLIEKILMKDGNNFPARKSFNFGHMSNRIGLLFVPTTESKWIRMRSLIEPTFSKSKLRKLTPKMNDCAFKLLGNLEAITSASGTVDLVKLYEAFALDVVAATAFGISLDSYNDPTNPLVKNARYFYSGSTPYKRLLFELYVSLRHLNHKVNPLESEQLSYFTRLAERIFREKQLISSKKKKYSNGLTSRKGDFIDFFIDMMDKSHDEMPESIEEEMTQGDDQLIEPIDSIDIYGHVINNCESATSNGSSGGATGKTIPSLCPMKVSSRGLSMDQVKAHGILFFIAGYGSTSSLLSNMSYLLAKNRRVQQLVIDEINAVSKSNNATWAHGLNADLIDNLTYLSAVVWETLRLYPSISRVERLCVTAYKLSDKYTIPAGMNISVPTYAIHRSPKFFSSPDEFKPERFLSDEPLKHPWSFLPFGGGPRNCLGMRLAILQTKVAIVRILENYELSLAPGHEDIKHISDQVLIAPESMYLSLKSRPTKAKLPVPFRRNLSVNLINSRQRLKRQSTF